jgi:hypothetical protein
VFPRPLTLEATAMTFGFDSAVACATDALDRLRTTAQSHERVMVLEVMGRLPAGSQRIRALPAAAIESERAGRFKQAVGV